MAFGFNYAYVYLIDKYIPGPYLAEYHKKLCLIFVAECWLSYFYVLSLKPLTCKDKLLAIAKDKDAHLKNPLYEMQPYDGVYYEEGQECRSCKIPKLARSKHCAVCDTCVDYFDHHCIWINACVTRSNIRGFLIFVLSHTILCVYGGVVFVLVILGEVSKINDTKLE